MRCPYCKKSVVGEKNVEILTGIGPAHRLCYEQTILSQRIFEGLNLPRLSDDKLCELQEMLLTEINSRSHVSDDVELFC
ncbi:hypothetical protein ACU6U9_10000 [Pseudomonas sp. HK3]|jgi:hypothetical protein